LKPFPSSFYIMPHSNKSLPLPEIKLRTPSRAHLKARADTSIADERSSRSGAPPCKTLRSKPQRRGKKQPVLVSEASSTGCVSDQYCLTMVTSTGSSCDQYWLLSPYRESPSDSRATPLPLHYTTPLFIGFANEAR